MKQRLPAVDIEIPRIGIVVYVHDELYIDEKINVQIAVIVEDEHKKKQLQTFMYACHTLGEATDILKKWKEQLQKGPFMFIQHKA